jgi:hypothetical protein
MLMDAIIARDHKPFSGFALKLVAIFAMTVDHLAWAIFPGFSTEPIAVAMHIIRRLTAPIMMFMIAEGFHYTKSAWKYWWRLTVFAVASHFAYCFLFGIPYVPNSPINQTSVLWPFSMGLLALIIDKSNKLKPPVKTALVSLAFVAAFPGDWSSPAALAIFYMAQNRHDFKRQAVCLAIFMACYASVYIFALNLVYGLIQMATLLAVPIFCLYNGKRGRYSMKWFFYLYYPMHMVILALIFGTTHIN